MFRATRRLDTSTKTGRLVLTATGCALLAAAISTLALIELLQPKTPAFAHFTHPFWLDCPQAVVEGSKFRATLHMDSDGDHFTFDHDDRMKAYFSTQADGAREEDFEELDEVSETGGFAKRRVGRDVQTTQDDLFEGTERFLVNSRYYDDNDNEQTLEYCFVYIIDDEVLDLMSRKAGNLNEDRVHKRGAYDERQLAHRFRTGANGDGYHLGYVDLSVDDAPDDFVTVTVTIRTDGGEGENPSSHVLTTLADPQAENTGTQRFYVTDFDPVFLQPSTNYWVVIQNSGTDAGDFELDLTDSNDTEVATGWDMAGHSLQSTNGGSSWERFPGDDEWRSLKLAVYARELAKPRIESVEIVSDPGPDQVYAIGDQIIFRVRFSEQASLSGTDARLFLPFNLGGETPRLVRWSLDDPPSTVEFTYTVMEGDADSDGVSIDANALSVSGGGFLKNAVTHDIAVLDHDALEPRSDAIVDGVRPTVSSAVVVRDALTLTFSEDLNADSEPDAGAFAVSFANESDPTVDDVTVSGDAVTLTLDPPTEAGETVTVTYTVPSSDPIEDLAGNDAEGFQSRSVANNTPGVFVSTGDLAVDEGDETSYTVVLAAKPTDDVQIEVRVDGAATAFQTVTFTPTDWNDPKTMPYTPPEDADTNDETHVLSHHIKNGSATEYLDVTVDDVTVSVTDDDSEVSIAAGSDIPEGGTTTFTLTRTGNTALALDVNVTVEASGGADIAGTPPTNVNFAANDTVVTFDVADADDKVIGESQGAITATIQAGVDPEEGAGYAIKSGEDSAGITVSDDDTAADAQWSLSLAGTTINEGQPGKTTTLSITNWYTFAQDQDLTLLWGGAELAEPLLQLENTQSISTLTLNAGDSSVQGTLVYPENDLRDRFFTSDYGSATRTLEARLGADKVDEVTAVTLTDNEEVPAVSILAPNSIQEGFSVVVLVQVSPKASYPITVAISHDDPDGALTGTVPTSVTISAQNGNSNFRVYTAQDALESDHKAASFSITGVTVSGSNNPDAAVLGSRTSDSVTVRNDDFTPGPPGNLQAASGDTLVNLTWNTGSAGKLNGSSTAITGYEYRQSTDGGKNWNPDWTDIPGSDASTVSHQVTGLLNDTEYTFQVRAVNAVGKGAASEDTAGSFSALITKKGFVPGNVKIYIVYPDWFLSWGQPLKAPQAWDNDSWDNKSRYNNGFDRYDVQYRWQGPSETWTDWEDIILFNNPPTWSSPSGDQPNSLFLTDWGSVRLEIQPPINVCRDRQWRVRALYDGPTRHSEWVKVRDRLNPGERFDVNEHCLPIITGMTYVAQTLTVDTTGIRDTNGLTNVSFNYQWIRIDGSASTNIAGETASSYVLSSADVSKTIKVRITFTDDAGNQETRTSAATDEVTATAPTEPTEPRSLTVTSGSRTRELHASWEAPAFNGGAVITGYKVQWKEADDSWDTEADVSQARITGTSHIIAGLTGGVEYTLRVIAFNKVGDGPASTEVTGTPASRTSQQNTEPENTEPTGLPAIRGTVQAGRTLTTDTSGINDADGLTSVSYSYQWIRSDADMRDATGSTYTVSEEDVGRTIKVRVSFTDDMGNQESLTSEATTEVTARPNSPAAGQPTISGAAQVDETLTAETTGISDEDGLTGVAFNYQWIRSDNGSQSDISGANGSSYELTKEDEGKAIKVRVSFTDEAGHAESLVSQATSPVAAAPEPEDPDTDDPSAPLTASVHGVPGSHDGANVFTFELRFSEELKSGFSFKTLRDHALTATAGEITRAKRVSGSGNTRFTIHVQPDGNADVAVLLATTTDCEAQHAICTQDGRPLSNGFTITVSGPST